MGRIRRVLGTALLCLCAAGPASAQDTWGPETVKLTGVGSTTSGGVYVGPYGGRFLDQEGAPVRDIFCVDWLHRVRVGQEWEAYLTRLGRNADLSRTRGGEGTLDTYRKMAWLTQQFAVAPAAEWGRIHAAIWQFFAPATAPNPGATATARSASWWKAEAEARWDDPGMRYADFVVVTPVNRADARGPQEMITAMPTTVPEPRTYVMLATGLLAVLGVAFRRGLG